ncbi:YbaK/EbsC family protein [Vallicoccus soli]|uniref:YbaK/EbsC family protein n=1 Tax=Vallicoccus soli TaxID=2339232 RepID=UPI001C49BB47|nr:YbaK/EbsC family protein [Vallicoccus soli]
MADPLLEHPAVVRVRAALRARGATGSVSVLGEAARTARAAADQLGCDVGAIANSLVFLQGPAPGGAPVLVLTSGAHRVDEARVAALLGVPALHRAGPDAVRAATGSAIGGVGPVGHPAPLPTLVDEDLAGHPVVWAAAGHPRTLFPTTYDELLRITGGRAARVA